MHFKILDRQRSILVFDREGDVNYCASCAVFLYGDVGFMYQLNGHKFYELMAEKIGPVMQQLGVKTLQGYVSRGHARLMTIALRRAAEVTVVHSGLMAGHEMVWVSVSPKAVIIEHLLAQKAGDETIDIVNRSVT